MIALITYPNGPWKELLKGIFDGYDLRILLNEDGYLITEIYNKQKALAVTNIAKILLCNGDLEAFAETLPKDNIFIQIHRDKTYKFLFLTQKPEIIPDDDAKAKEFTTKQYQILDKNFKLIANIAKSYEIEIINFKDASLEAKKTLFLNPSAFFTLLQFPKLSGEIKNIAEKIIKLGFFKTSGEISKEAIDYFQKTNVIYNTDEKAKKHLIYVLAEEFALNKTNVLIFTFDKTLENLKYPNPNAEEIEKKLNLNPLGFPLSNFDVNNLHVDLSELPFDAFLDIFKLKNTKIEPILQKIFLEKPKSINIAYEKIKAFTNPDFNNYDINLSRRALAIIKIKYPNLFEGDYKVDYITKEWGEKLGKINIITLDEDLNKAAIVMHNILKKLANADKKIAIILPLDRFNSKKSLIFDYLAKEIANSKHYTFAFAKNLIDLHKEILEKTYTEIQIIDKEEIAVKIKDRRPYRLILRPTLSKI